MGKEVVEKTDSGLEDLHCASLRDHLGDAFNTDDRVPYVSQREDQLFNFWRDATHPRGCGVPQRLSPISSMAPRGGRSSSSMRLLLLTTLTSV